MASADKSAQSYLLHVLQPAVLEPYGFAGQQEHYIPLVSDIVPDMDVNKRVLYLAPPAGLLQLGRQSLVLEFLKQELVQYALPAPTVPGMRDSKWVSGRCIMLQYGDACMTLLCWAEAHASSSLHGCGLLMITWMCPAPTWAPVSLDSSLGSGTKPCLGRQHLLTSRCLAYSGIQCPVPEASVLQTCCVIRTCAQTSCKPATSGTYSQLHA